MGRAMDRLARLRAKGVIIDPEWDVMAIRQDKHSEEYDVSVKKVEEAKLKAKQEKVLVSRIKKMSNADSGIFYSKDGYFIGEIIGSQNAYIVNIAQGSITDNFETEYKKILSKYDVYDAMGLSNKEFLIFANICKIEESISDIGTFAVANSIMNFLIEGEKNWDYNLKGFIAGKPPLSSVSQQERVPFNYKKLTQKERIAISATCNAFLYYGDIIGAEDYSNGATHWDGFDFAARGEKHPKGVNQGYHIVHQQYVDDYLAFWTDEKVKSFSKNTYTKAAKLTTKPVIGQGTYSKGRILYKSVAQFGGTIFWAPNHQAKENQGYDWKYYYRF